MRVHVCARSYVSASVHVRKATIMLYDVLHVCKCCHQRIVQKYCNKLMHLLILYTPINTVITSAENNCLPLHGQWRNFNKKTNATSAVRLDIAEGLSKA